MKIKSIIVFLFAAFSVAGYAQTEFRSVSFDEALKVAKSENKLVFIDFFTTWCGPCKKMSKEVFPLKSVGEYMNATFVPLKLDAEKEGAALAKQYGVNAYPTYVILDANGEKKNSFSGAMGGDEFLDKLKQVADPNMTPERIKARYESGERSAALVREYAMMLMEARREQQGYKVVEDYFDSLSDADRVKGENSFIYTAYTFDFDSARGRFLREHLADFVDAKNEAVKKHAGKLLFNELSRYFSGSLWKKDKFNPEAFSKIKKDIDVLGQNSDGSYNALYGFIENRVKLSDKGYLTYAEKNYDKLSERAKEVFVVHITRIFEDKELNPQVALFLRSKLATMSPMAIQFAGHTIQTLEGDSKKGETKSFESKEGKVKK